MADFLQHTKIGACVVCKKETKQKDFDSGFYFCSIECYNKWEGMIGSTEAREDEEEEVVDVEQVEQKEAGVNEV